MNCARVNVLLGLLLAPALSFAGQPGPVQPPPNPNESNLFDVLNEQLKQKGKKLQETQEGVEMVAPARARSCDVCKQALYKHSDPGFECIPIDPETGQARRVLRIRTRQTQCPSCTAKFVGALPGNVNDEAGRDRDFCAHSVGKYAVHSSIWLCPTCGFASRADGWGTGLDGRPLSEPVKTFVRETLQPEIRKRMMDMAGLQQKGKEAIPEELLSFASYVTQTEIPDWIKYDHAVRIWEHAKASPRLLAPLYMEAAHACRREVYAEVAVPGLQNDLQVSLGKSIRRMNYYINNECLEIRRNRGESVLDPSKQESDPAVLAQAAKSIIKKGEDLAALLAKAAPAQAENKGADERFFTSGDMFVLHIRYAGILDRLGSLDEARTALDKALTFIPQKLTVNVDNQPNAQLQDYYEKQIKLLRGVVEERKKCLDRERDYLFKAARTNMAAIKFGEVKFTRYERGLPLPPADKDDRPLDAAPTCYLLGELLRRVGDTDGAAAFLDAASGISARILADLDKLGYENSRLSAVEYDRQFDRWRVMRDWSTEQRKLIKSAKAPEELIAQLVQQILTASGFSGIKGREAPATEQQPIPATTAAAAATTTKEPPSTQPAETVKSAKNATAPLPPIALDAPKASGKSGAGAAATRAELYKQYYAALLKFRHERKENPASLSELVKAGYIRQDECHLDAAGKLICPETGEKLGYSRIWEPGDKAAPILFSVPKPASKKLWANGDVR